MRQQAIAPMAPYVFFRDAFTPDQCDKIIAIAQAIGAAPAAVGNAGPGVVDKAVRSADVCWLHEQGPTRWIFNILEAAALDVHFGWFPCEVSHFGEPLQITHYKADDHGHYDWHVDMGDGAMRTRKLSMVAMLNDPGSFTGGHLELLSAPGDHQVAVERGMVVAFPSYMHHRVAPVTQGERWSLVAWMHGPIWR